MDAFSLSWGHVIIGEIMDLRRTLDGIGGAKESVMKEKSWLCVFSAEKGTAEGGGGTRWRRQWLLG